MAECWSLPEVCEPYSQVEVFHGSAAKDGHTNSAQSRKYSNYKPIGITMRGHVRQVYTSQLKLP